MLLFSGPASRSDRLASFLTDYGCAVTEYDWINDKRAQDLADDSVWMPIEEDLRAGFYDAAFGSPPCRTHCPARRLRPGPPILRTPEHPLGIPRAKAREFNLTESDLEDIKLDNLLASRTAEMCRLQQSTGGAAGVEQPSKMGPEHVTMYERDDFVALRKHSTFISNETDQCMFGGESQKPTEFLSFGMDLSRLERKCDHEPTWHWVKPVQGKAKWVLAPHPPKAGHKTPTGEWATAPLAQYPADLNKELAKRISEAAWRIFRFRSKKGPPPPAEKLVVPEMAADGTPVLE